MALNDHDDCKIMVERLESVTVRLEAQLVDFDRHVSAITQEIRTLNNNMTPLVTGVVSLLQTVSLGNKSQDDNKRLPNIILSLGIVIAVVMTLSFIFKIETRADSHGFQIRFYTGTPPSDVET